MSVCQGNGSVRIVKTITTEAEAYVDGLYCHSDCEWQETLYQLCKLFDKEIEQDDNYYGEFKRCENCLKQFGYKLKEEV